MNYEVKPLSKNIINVHDWEFEAQQRGEQPILLCDFFSRSLNTYFVKYITGEEKSFGYLFTDSNRLNRNIKESNYYFEIFKKKLDDKAFLENIIKNSVDIPKEFNRQADIEMAKLIDEKNTIENLRLAEYWKKLDDEFLKVIPWFWYPWFIAKEDLLVNRVKDGLEKFRSQIEFFTDFQEALLSIIFPIKKTNFQLEQEDMHELVLLAKGKVDFKDDQAFKNKAVGYLEKYDWLTTFILTPVLPMTYEQLIERVNNCLKENYEETFLRQRDESVKKEAMAERVIQIVNHDSSLMENIAFSRELAYGLTAGIEEAYISTSKYLTLLEMVASRVGVDFTDTKYFLSKEIYQTLTGEFIMDKEELLRREEGFTMVVLDGQQYVAYGSEGHSISEWIDRELNKVDESILEFKGQIACKGLARGKVKIASEPSRSHELKEGEILVCPMTNPDYVSAMKRSVAIITDEGGLLSHAAIMSREFNKPCIIGTKIATKLLKDGDVVEVDANNGIVKIIERSK